jgi:hypothetical protein
MMWSRWICAAAICFGLALKQVRAGKPPSRSLSARKVAPNSNLVSLERGLIWSKLYPIDGVGNLC